MISIMFFPNIPYTVLKTFCLAPVAFFLVFSLLLIEIIVFQTDFMNRKSSAGGKQGCGTMGVSFYAKNISG
jgi:hypothetical protein